MTGFTDWTEVGIFPLQDHDDAVAMDSGNRQQMVGGRIKFLRDPTNDLSAEESLLEFATEDNLGTLGDIHPWLFWQTRFEKVTNGENLRATGSWSMAWGAMTMCGGTGGVPGQREPSATVVQPLIVGGTQGGWELVHDLRYATKKPLWPRSLPTLPRGVMVIVTPSSEHMLQEDMMHYADPRLFAPNVKGPGTAGTLVCDLQPEAEPCMDNAPPGLGGRHARLQSMMRVIAMNRPGYGHGNPNAIAWQCAAVGGPDGGGDGYGLCYFPPGKIRGPITGQSRLDDPPSGAQNLDFDTCMPKQAKTGRAINDFGKFQEHDTKGLLAYMSYAKGGPLHPGADGGEDRHVRSKDGDGHYINSGHITTNALFYASPEFDGPLFFEGRFPPDVKRFTQKVHVHLKWDADLKMWRWHSYSWVHTNGGGNGTQPWGEGADSTPPKVGLISKEDERLKLITHPHLESFTQMVFRPQFSVEGATSWLHEIEVERTEEEQEETDNDFARRPQVLAMRTWGAQDAASSRWVHNEDPKTSRAYGGTADGGILFAPPRQEIEDYFSINSDGDIYDATTMGYVTCAPDTAFALGTPNSDGGLNAKSVTIEQSAAAASNHKLLIYQLNSSRVKKALFEGELDQSSGEMIVSLASGGKECIRIPRGTTAERPGTLTLTGGEIRANTTGTETIEFLDPDSDGLGTAAWVTLATPRANVFTGHQTLNDNISLKLGTGGDSTITYNGTNTIWDPKAVGSGYVRLNGKMGFNVAPAEEVHAADTVRADTKFNYQGTDGLNADISFYDALGGTQSVTVRGGIILAWTS